MTDRELRLAAIHEGGHGCIGADLGYPPELLTIEGDAVAHSKHVGRPEDQAIIAALSTGAHFFELTPDALHFAVRQMVIDYAGPVAGRIAERRTGYQPIRLTPEPAREWEPRTMPDGLPEPEIVEELLGKAPPVNDEPMAQARAFQNAGLTGAYLAEWAHAEAQVRVRARWGLIEQVAEALLRHRTLDRAAFEAIYTAPGDAHGPTH